MELLKRLKGPLRVIVLLAVVFIILKTAPSVLWPEKHNRLISDEGFIGGHQTIGINERALDRDSNALLFSTLRKWKYSKERPVSSPEEIQAYHGSAVRVVGFMYPLESGTKIKTFCLLRSTQTCCYGPRPQYSEYVLVEMNQPVPFERLRPVEVTGTFYVEPRPDDGYIYRLAGSSARVITG